MITGFNPTDMYAADHIRRVLQDLSRRVLRDRRVHDPQGVRVLEDRRRRRQPDRPGARPHPRLRGRGRPGRHHPQRHPHAVRKPEKARVYFDQMKALLARHPKTTIIWAHTGLGRVIQPIPGHVALLEEILKDPGLRQRVFRHLVDRGGEVRRRFARVGRDHCRYDQALSGPFPVRHGRGRAGGPADAICGSTISTRRSGRRCPRRRARSCAWGTTSDCSTRPGARCAPGKPRTCNERDRPS